MTDAILRFQDDKGNHTFLSNFYPSPISQRVYDPNVVEQFSTLTFPTVENFFQAQKSNDILEKTRICGATPGMSKKLGRAVALRKDWEEIKLKVMRAALDLKFPNLVAKNNQNVLLTEMLLDTGDAYLEEGNTWGDTYWGTVNGAGQNWLGVLLMARRTALRYYETKEVSLG